MRREVTGSIGAARSEVAALSPTRCQFGGWTTRGRRWAEDWCRPSGRARGLDANPLAVSAASRPQPGVAAWTAHKACATVEGSGA